MSLRVVIRKKAGDFDGLADDALALWKPRAIVAVTDVTEMLYSEIQRELSHKRAQPSPQGQPPREVTGRVRRSIKKIKTRATKYKVRGGIRSRHPGIKRLEFVTHPFMRPVIFRLRGTIDRLFRDA